MTNAKRPPGFDGGAAVTRSLLGYGVVAGIFYLVVGSLLALLREGFDLSQHSLSLLMLGEGGWMQRANLLLTGVMTAAAGFGIRRVDPQATPSRRAGTLVLVYGAALVISGIFAPDPMAGFPPGSSGGDPSVSGLIHLAAGGIGFLALAAAAFSLGTWFQDRQRMAWTLRSRIAGALVIVGFLAGAALATQTLGVLALWLAVVVGWLWLGAASVALYKVVPHPDPDKRQPRVA